MTGQSSKKAWRAPAALAALLALAVVLLLLARNPVKRYLGRLEPLKARSDAVLAEAADLSQKHRFLSGKEELGQVFRDPGQRDRLRSGLKDVESDLQRLTTESEAVRIELRKLQPPEKARALHGAFEQQLDAMVSLGNLLQASASDAEMLLQRPLDLRLYAHLRSAGEEAKTLQQEFERSRRQVESEFATLSGG